MKKAIFLLLSIAVLFCASSAAAAQGRKTIILIRHAERADTGMTASNDPELSAVGRERAERLVKLVGKFRPGAFYSTNFKRTRETVEPLAKKRNKKVQIYDPAKPQDLISAINSNKTKRFVIVGHSNTIPGLANLLTGKDLFKNLQESEYSVVWVIKMRQGKVTKVELLDY
jgi:2,3-bisphosphoglycerate-dependent phosphoglycerate mutase